MHTLNIGIIGGCGSSGTTLLIGLLGRSPYVFSGPEFNFFNHDELYKYKILSKNIKKMYRNKAISRGYFFTNWFLTERKYYGINNDLVSRWINESNDTFSFAHRVISHVLIGSKGNCFIEKTPSNIYFFKNILKTFKDVPIIHVVRDGRDVVTSLMKRGFSLFGAGSRWLYDTACGISNRGHKNYIEIKYEDLVTDPAEVLGLVFEHLKIPFYDPAIVKPSFKRSGFSMEWKDHEVGKLWNMRPSDPISTDLIGRYKKRLDSDDLSILKKINLKKSIAKELSININSFNDLLDYLNYTKDKLPDSKNSLGRVKQTVIEIEDYVQRLKTCWEIKYWALPRRVTYLSL